MADIICITRATKRIFGPRARENLPPPSPSILQIMILKLSPQRCVISKESKYDNHDYTGMIFLLLVYYHES
jgi:hypothetical protein